MLEDNEPGEELLDEETTTRWQEAGVSELWGNVQVRLSRLAESLFTQWGGNEDDVEDTMEVRTLLLDLSAVGIVGHELKYGEPLIRAKANR